MKSNFLKRAAMLSFFVLCLAVTPSFAQYRNQINAMSWFLLGVNYGNQGDFNSAIHAFGQAIRLKPDYSQAWFYLGVALARSGRQNEAMFCIKQAMQLNPGYADNPGYFELLRSLGLQIGPTPQPRPNLNNPYLNLGRAGGIHKERGCEDDRCYQCGGDGEIEASGNAYSGAGYQSARSCPNCRGTGRVRRCY